MPTRNVVLTDSQAGLIDKLVRNGRYQNASEVIRDGMRLLQEREAEEAARIEAMREAILVGARDLEAGRYKEFESMTALTDYLEKKARAIINRA